VFTDEDNDITFKTKFNNKNHTFSNKRFEKINLHVNFTKDNECNSEIYELDSDEDESVIYINDKKVDTIINESINKKINEDSLQYRLLENQEVENWRDLGEPKRHRSSYLQPNKEWLQVDLSKVK